MNELLTLRLNVSCMNLNTTNVIYKCVLPITSILSCHSCNLPRTHKFPKSNTQNYVTHSDNLFLP